MEQFFHIMWKTDASIRSANMGKNIMSRMRSGQRHFWSTREAKQRRLCVLSAIWACNFIVIIKNQIILKLIPYYSLNCSYCVEVLHSGGHEGLCHLPGRDHTWHGVAVANRFPHSDNVWHKVLSLELKGPEVGADPPEAHLDLIRDKNTPCLVDMSVNVQSVYRDELKHSECQTHILNILLGMSVHLLKHSRAKHVNPVHV